MLEAEPAREKFTSSQEWERLEAHLRAVPPRGVQVSHVGPALSLLRAALQASPVQYRRDLNKQVSSRPWTRRTAQKILGTVRIILRHTKAPLVLVRATRLLPPTSFRNTLLGAKYGCLPVDDPARVKVEQWAARLQEVTHNRSPLSVRNVMSYLLCVALPRLGISPQQSPEEIRRVLLLAAPPPNLIEGKQAWTKWRWLKTFVNDVLEVADWQAPKPSLKRRCQAREEEADVHRIAKADLERLYEVAKRDVTNELFFMCLLTTGMRIGGYAKLKCGAVADLRDGVWRARCQGQTTEKGNKLFTFRIHQRVAELLEVWLNELRCGDDESPWLFPGRFADRHVVTDAFRKRFQAMCKAADLRGTHPHALRHTFSHILLEVGNPVDVVSKLINHANPMTTQKFYLKETAAEVARRANIPWMPAHEEPEDPVPSFLRGTHVPPPASATLTRLQNWRSKLAK